MPPTKDGRDDTKCISEEGGRKRRREERGGRRREEEGEGGGIRRNLTLKSEVCNLNSTSETALSF